MPYSFDLNRPGLEMPRTKHEEHLRFLNNLGALGKEMNRVFELFGFSGSCLG